MIKNNQVKIVAKFDKVSEAQFLKDSKESNSVLLDDIPEKVIERCYESIKLPERKTRGSAGYDFFSPCDLVILPHNEAMIPSGIKCRINYGYHLKLYPRSSLGVKYRISLVNTVGVIDSDYYNNEGNEGHIIVHLFNPTKNKVVIKAGEAYCQGVIEPFYLAEGDKATTKRVGGFGSTNSK